MAPKLLRPTSGKEWRTARTTGTPIQLPHSGHIAIVRPVEPGQLIKQGEVLDILSPLVSTMLFEGTDAGLAQIQQAVSDASGDDPTALQRAIANLGSLERMCDIVCRAAFLNPRIVDDPQADDEIALDDLALQDKIHVTNLSLAGAIALERFRYQPAPDVAAVPDGEGDGQPAQRPDDDSGPVGGAPV